MTLRLFQSGEKKSLVSHRTDVIEHAVFGTVYPTV